MFHYVSGNMHNRVFEIYDGHADEGIKKISNFEILDMFEGQFVLHFTKSKKRNMP